MWPACMLHGTYLSLGGDSTESLAVVGKSHDGRCGPLALSVFNNLSVVSLHDCDAGVGGAQIDSNNPATVRTTASTYDENCLLAVYRCLVFYLFKSALSMRCVYKLFT